MTMIKEIQTLSGVFAVDTATDKKMADIMEHGGRLNDDLIAIACYFVGLRGIAVDVGAHIGSVSVPLAKNVQKTIAFEPVPHAFALLVRNAQRNGVTVDARNKGLGAVPSKASAITRKDANAGANTLVVGGGEIIVSTLDAEVERADFIKIDVEGMEAQVLDGGKQLIERSRPVVLFEVNLSQLRSHDSSPRALEKFFGDRGYNLFWPTVEHERIVLHKVASLTLLTIVRATGSWFLHTESAPFDILAIPKERPVDLPQKKFMAALVPPLREKARAYLKRLHVAP